MRARDSLIVTRGALLTAIVGLMLTASAFTAVGFVVANRFKPAAGPELPMILRADSATGCKGLSLATGFVARDVDALYVLDHLTGNLQCWLLNPQTGKIGGIFRTNVNADLGVVKAGDVDFVMVTTRIPTAGRQREGNLRPGECLVYVGDGNSGKVIGYGFQFVPAQFNERDDTVQQGELIVVTQGLARGLVERDQ
jgi:hypothetical protein